MKPGERDAPTRAEDLPGPEWLPGLPVDFEPENRLDGRTVTGATFWVPQLTDREAVAVATRVRHAALAARRSHRAADVCTAIGRAARRLADPDDEIGSAAVAAVRHASGASDAAARELLREHAAGWSGADLSALVRSELGELAVLDAPRPDPSRPGRRRRAVGPPVVHLVLAGNVPGVGVTAVIRSLVARSGVLCKVPASEPWLVGLFARALQDEDPELAASLAATWWPADTPGPAGIEWPKRSSKVIVYGGAEAVRAIRSRTPGHVPVVAYGPRIGIVVLGPATTDAEFEGLARDVLAYDQAGCVSPRLVFLLGVADDSEGTGARRLLDRLASALGAEAARHGPGFTSDEEAVAIRRARSRLQFDPDPGDAVLGPETLAWTILHRGRSSAASEPLPRVVWSSPLGSVRELVEFRNVLDNRVQALGVAGVDGDDRKALEELAVELGVSRVARPGSMAWPPIDWRHDGRMQLMPLLRWTDFEDELPETTDTRGTSRMSDQNPA